MKVRTSLLDGKTTVVEIEDGDKGPLVKMLDNRGHGYAVFGEGIEEPIAVVDGRLYKHDWFTQDHLLAIEAHELGHINKSSNDESVAELEAIRLLNETGNSDAANLLLDRGVV